MLHITLGYGKQKIEVRRDPGPIGDQRQADFMREIVEAWGKRLEEWEAKNVTTPAVEPPEEGP
jgi:hypothetical protein